MSTRRYPHGFRAGFWIVIAVLSAIGEVTPRALGQGRADGLRIIVIEGEDAVNIVQQKTAVAPVVEVRDRNDQPVAGAVVRFSIQGGRATFNGARTLTLTTNAAGRAAVTGLTPTGSGALEITASAAFQGETAAATITQTNVLSAAAAPASAVGASAAGVGAGATAAGGAGSGGLSTAAIGAIAAGAGAGTIVAVVGAADNQSGDSNAQVVTYVGSFNGLLITHVSLTPPFGTPCDSTRSLVGTISLLLTQAPDGSVSGSGSVSGTETEIAVTPNSICPAQVLPPVPIAHTGTVSGTTESLSFISQGAIATPPMNVTFRFAGALSSGIIVGTISYTEGSQTTNGAGVVITRSGAATIPVTLR